MADKDKIQIGKLPWNVQKPSHSSRKFSLVATMMSLARSRGNNACSVFLSNMADGPAEDEESEVFEITDFTTASEWERFIARLEEVLHEWMLAGGSHRTSSTSVGSTAFHPEPSKVKPLPEQETDDEREGTWAFVQENINFANFSFNIAYHYLKTRKSGTSRTSISHGGNEDSLPATVMDMFDMEFDFPPRVHCLSRWFGLKEFIVLSPAQNTEAIDNESRCHLLLSSIAIAFNNSKCEIPMFIQAHQRWRRLYYGLCLGGEFRTLFEMCHLKHTPPQYAHLAGLLEVFKDKLACPLSPLPPVTVSIRFTYILDEWTDYAWPQDLPHDPLCFECSEDHTEFAVLPFGACEDPVSELHLSTTWPCLTEDVVVDNSVYSDLDPMQAPEWSVRVRMCENPQCLLGDHFGSYMKLCYRQESTLQLLHQTHSDDSEADITQALQKLTDPGHGLPVASLSSAVTKATTHLSVLGELSPQEFAIPQPLLNHILKQLFPDANEDADSLQVMQDEICSKAKDACESSDSRKQDRFRGLKSAPEQSLTFSLATCLCLVYNRHGGLRAVAHLWHEFVLEMRYRWENDVFIPRLPIESPNLGCCLIHQKLQMLNCCIERRRSSRLKHGNVKQQNSAQTSTNKSSSNKDGLCLESEPKDSSSEGDEDEFFEAVEDFSSFPEPSDSGVNEITREGVLRRCGELYLLAKPCEPLYVPVTQEPAPMTEDMLQQHAEVLTQLGTTEEGARVRAQMQSASLLSDMEAFKAANPGCLLEDFVRWYSPNDWLQGPETVEEREELIRQQELATEALQESRNSTESAQVRENPDGWADDELEVTEEELLNIEKTAAAELMSEAKAGHVPELHSRPKWAEEGRLSLRMRVPGNMWEEVWHSAKPIPVRRQKRLFDETKEAEKVLHFLVSLKPSEVAFQLFPVLLHAILLRLEGAGGRDIVAIADVMDKVLKSARKLHWVMPDDLPHCEEIVREMQLAELVIARANSLQFKFRDALNFQRKKLQEVGGERSIDEFLAALREKPEVNVIGAGRGPAGRVIHRLFAKQATARLEQSRLENPSDSKSSSSPAQQDFPTPTGREYILRTSAPRPARSSRVSPQRMYCVLTADEFRLAGAFTEDVTFQ
ncbi:rab3 GTPase-activating protein catalytic subunit isoform X2 [Nematostella vectensis]|uniref:rab3 GTPase-activating protein catalytic subunit isoform X2 n=1 Tax=Nematostella vectensis TaxID=45351 RepID=UPI002076DCFB|nr:rab3 GTPase-activating protein catalytic subunit isoform X2 [Nematostella vectensis]